MYAIKVGNLYYSQSEPTTWVGDITKATAWPTAEQAGKVVDYWRKSSTVLGGALAKAAEVQGIDDPSGVAIELQQDFIEAQQKIQRLQNDLDEANGKIKDLTKKLTAIQKVLG